MSRPFSLFAALVLAALAPACRKGPPAPAAAGAPAIERVEATPAPPPKIVEELTADPKRLDEEVARLAKAAAADHRRLLVYFHADWCEPCKEAQKAFKRYENAGSFKGWYLVMVNVDQLPEGPAIGLPVEKIPLFARLDEKGAVEATMTGAAFGDDADPHMVDAAFHDFLGETPKSLP